MLLPLFNKPWIFFYNNLKLSCVLVYLDDINVFSRTLNKHLQHLEKVFKRLEDANLKIKPSKCSFFKEQIEYLGYIVSKEGLKPQPWKVEAVKKMSIPKNKKDIQVFLGMMGYYRRFIENFSKIGLPLFQLLKKDTPFIWTKNCQNCFNTLKAKLTLAPILLHPNYTKEFLLQTDASCMAVGAVFSYLWYWR